MPAFSKDKQTGGPRDRRSRRAMNAVSDREGRKRETRGELRGRMLRLYPYCELKRAGAPGGCYGMLTLHHVWPLGRGGPDVEANACIACAEHNRMLSQDAEVMAWGEANGYLVHGAEGPRWLAAGGVRR